MHRIGVIVLCLIVSSPVLGVTLKQAEESKTCSGSTPLVLVHGYTASPSAWNAFLSYYRQTPELCNAFKVFLFDYSEYGNDVTEWVLFDVGSELRDEIAAYYSRSDAASWQNKRIVILGHSMGGLVARSFMQQHWFSNGPPGGERVLRLLTLGTPHHGSPLANEVTPFPKIAASPLRWDDYDQNPLTNNDNWILRCLNNYSSLQRFTVNACPTAAEGDRDGFYDKIIAYGGTTLFSNRPGYALAGTELTLLGYGNNDALVPIQSSLFDDWPIAARRRSDDACDHTDLHENIDCRINGERLFDVLNRDLLEAVACSDIYEPNNNSSDAYGPIVPATSYAGRICSPADSDWFKLNLQNGASVTVALTPPPGMDYNLELYATNGQWLSGSYKQGDANESITHTATMAGTYHVRVYGVGTAHDLVVPFRLSYTTTTAPCFTLERMASPLGAGTVSTSATNCAGGYTLGSNISLSAASESGYAFHSWSATNGSLASNTTSTTTFTINGNASITATFTPTAPGCYTLSTGASPQDSGGVIIQTPQNCSGGHTAGSTLSINAVPAAGYQFVSWSAEGGSIANSNEATTTFTIRGYAQLTAHFAPASGCFTLQTNVSPSSTGIISVPTQQNCSGGYTSGTQIDVIGAPNAGYRFVHWQGTGGMFADGNSGTTRFTITGNASIAAIFTASCQDVYPGVAPAGSGYVTTHTFANCDGAFQWGTPISYSATAYPGYEFVEWTGSGGSFSSTTTPNTVFTIYGLGTVTANFRALPPCLFLSTASSPSASGTISASATNCSGGYTDGTVVSITANPGGGHVFQHWEGIGGAIGNPTAASTTFTISENAQLTAYYLSTACFELATGAAPDGAGGITLSPAQTCNGGYRGDTPVTLQAMPAAHRVFMHWSSGGGTLTSATAPTSSFSLTAPASVTANFTNRLCAPQATATADYSLFERVDSVATGDVDGDDRADVVMTIHGSFRGLVFRNESGAFADKFRDAYALETYTEPEGIALADIDGDGKRDVITADAGGNRVTIFRNTTTAVGGPSFAVRAGWYAYTPHRIVVGDVDGDGKIDIAASSNAGFQISVFRNISTPGNLELDGPYNFALDGSPDPLALADVDGDGKLDLVVPLESLHRVDVLRNTSQPGTFSFAAKVSFSTGMWPRGVTIAHLDGNSAVDVAVANGGNGGGSVSVLRNGSTGAGSIAFSREDVATGLQSNRIVATDFDGDGRSDLAVTNYGDSNVSLLLNVPSPDALRFERTDVPLGFFPSGIAAASFDTDGKIDLAIVGNVGDLRRLRILQNVTPPCVIELPPVTPQNLVATATSLSQINLTWSSVPSVTYEVERNSGNGYVHVATSQTNAYTDNDVTSGKAYAYRVRSVNSIGGSGYTVPDLATTIAFTNDPLNAGTIIRAVHVTQLREAVNSVRAAAGLAAASFTNASLVGMPVRATHIVELRTSLAAARASLGLAAVAYDTINAGSAVQAVHLTQLRSGVR